jgi:large subunit ribosomal protein L13
MTEIKRETHIIDAKDQIVGRLAVEIARILSGKHKPTYVPYEDRGDFVTIKNIKNIKVSGNKEEQKKYFHHSGFMGGLKINPFKRKFSEDPQSVLIDAVMGMLPKNKLRAVMIKKLKFED